MNRRTRQNPSVTVKDIIPTLGASAADARAAVGASEVGDAVFTAEDEAAARAAIEFDATYTAKRSVADIRDWSGVSAWRSTSGAEYTSGQNTIKNNVAPFTQADVGKIVIVTENVTAATDGLGQPVRYKWMATIISVNGSGVAQVDSVAPSSGTNQRINWGFDNTVALNQAMAEMGGDDSTTRELYLPRVYAASQLVLPDRLLLRGGGWGDYGYTATGMSSALWQLPGSEKDFIVVNPRYSNGYFGPGGLVNLSLVGPSMYVRGKSRSVGNGLTLRKADGTAQTTQDGFVCSGIHTTRFPESGFLFANGGVPLTVADCRAFYNGGYGLDYVSNGASTTQAVHVLGFSADGNNSAGMRFKNVSSYGSIVITSYKAEYAAYLLEGSPGYQYAAMIFEDCDQSPVVINCATQIAGAPYNNVTGAGPVVIIRSESSKRPRITYNAISNRVFGTESGSTADAVIIRDEVVSRDVPRTEVSGIWPPPSRRLDMILDQNGNPVLDWMLGNVEQKTTSRGGPVKYYYPTRPTESQKIDAVPAALMALDGALRAPATVAVDPGMVVLG